MDCWLFDPSLNRSTCKVILFEIDKCWKHGQMNSWDITLRLTRALSSKGSVYSTHSCSESCLSYVNQWLLTTIWEKSYWVTRTFIKYFKSLLSLFKFTTSIPNASICSIRKSKSRTSRPSASVTQNFRLYHPHHIMFDYVYEHGRVTGDGSTLLAGVILKPFKPKSGCDEIILRVQQRRGKRRFHVKSGKYWAGSFRFFGIRCWLQEKASETWQYWHPIR